MLVTNCFSTRTSYENQTKKAITNKFIQEAMTEFFRAQLEIYFIEHKTEADRVMEQVPVSYTHLDVYKRQIPRRTAWHTRRGR